jgi:hypothetical protein
LQRSKTVLAFVFLSAAVSANAGLLGTDVTLNYNYDAFSTTDIVTVQAGLEVICLGGGSGNANICSILTAPNQAIDFDDLSITYLYERVGSPTGFSPIAPNGFDFQNLNVGAPIAGVVLSTSIAGLDASRLSFSANSIQLNMVNLALGESESFTLQIVTTPEPSAGLMAGLGGLLLGVQQLLRRRRQK